MILAFNVMDLARLLVAIAVASMLAMGLAYAVALVFGPFVGLALTRYWYVALAFIVLGAWALIRVIKADPGNKTQPILALSAVWVLALGGTIWGQYRIDAALPDEARVFHALAQGGTFHGPSAEPLFAEVMSNRDRAAFAAIIVRPRHEPCRTALAVGCYTYVAPDGLTIDYTVSSGINPAAIWRVLGSDWAPALACTLPDPSANCASYSAMEEAYNINLAGAMQAHLRETGQTCGQVSTCAILANVTGEAVTADAGVTSGVQAGAVDAPEFMEACTRLGRLNSAQCRCYAAEFRSAQGSAAMTQINGLYARRLANHDSGISVNLSAGEQALEDGMLAAAQTCAARGL